MQTLTVTFFFFLKKIFSKICNHKTLNFELKKSFKKKKLRNIIHLIVNMFSFFVICLKFESTITIEDKVYLESVNKF